MGLLDQMFGGGDSKSGGGGGMSPMTLALLGILAWQTYNGRGRLADMLGRKAPDGDAPPSPGQPLPRGVPDDRVASRDDGGGLDDLLRQRSGGGGGLGDILSGGSARGSGGGGGGLGDILGGMLGGGSGAGRGGGGLGDILGGMLGGGASSGGRAGGGGLGDILGGMLGGGAAGGAVTGGLGELLKRFQETGRGEVADSWVHTGPNRLVSRQDIEGAIDPEVIDVLAEQYGVSRDAVLDNLAHDLPEAVDKLTPEGRLPTREEADRWV